ncbi:hypothetical protein KUTeg_017225 [Tegillarca granosa]|uniref:Uncharacterized protein n=1 Tax=Tegillarca granosa TaxID=220873 RepID=A0ABQ9EPP1_TEGGR|nr:hypothetical protein KUTeg_017225 [Tegillarca granosa]
MCKLSIGLFRQRRNISQCVVDNGDQMVTSDNPESWAIGLVFQKSAFDLKSNAICKRLAEVASELECILYETGDVPCGSGFSELIPNIYSLYKANNITEEKARSLICRMLYYQQWFLPSRYETVN